MRDGFAGRTEDMRQLRQLQAGACYHVTARANRKEYLLRSPLARDLFVETLVRCRAKYLFNLDNFVLMENHVHLLITPSRPEDLPIIMKWLLGVYTMRYNKCFKTWGRVWGSRYYSRPIRHLEDYIVTSSYIDNNPVKAVLTGWARDWPWSACYHRSRGIRILVAPLPDWLLMRQPAHDQLRLGV